MGRHCSQVYKPMAESEVVPTRADHSGRLDIVQCFVVEGVVWPVNVL